MNPHDRQSLRPALLLAGVIALIAGPIILYSVLPLSGVSASLVSGVVVVAGLKHLGLLALFLTPRYVLRRRAGRADGRRRGQ